MTLAHIRTGCYDLLVDAGWSSPVARWAHNPKVAGSNPAPATIATCSERSPVSGDLFAFWARAQHRRQIPFQSMGTMIGSGCQVGPDRSIARSMVLVFVLAVVLAARPNAVAQRQGPQPVPDPAQGDGDVSAFYTWDKQVPATPGRLLRQSACSRLDWS